MSKAIVLRVISCAMVFTVLVSTGGVMAGQSPGTSSGGTEGPNVSPVLSCPATLTSIKVPCNSARSEKSFLRSCSDVTHLLTEVNSKKPQAGQPGDGAGAKSFLMRYGKFLYNYGEDAKGNPVILPVSDPDQDGYAVDLSAGNISSVNYQPFGKPCSRCVTEFNEENAEIASDYKGKSCGTETRVSVSLGGTLVFLGTNAHAWYRGLYTLILSKTMQNVHAQIKSSQSPVIPVSEGCQAFGCRLFKLTNRINQIEKDLERNLGKEDLAIVRTAAGEVDKDFKEWEPKGTKVRDPGHLRQLAQDLNSLRRSMETAAGYLTGCNILDTAGRLFREKVGSWDEFASPAVMAGVNARVKAKVHSACAGACSGDVWKHIGRCLACLNNAANAYTPPEIAKLFQNKCEELEAAL